MIKKKENCLYCGEKMESLTAKKSFCSVKCRVYFSRANKTQSSITVEFKELRQIATNSGVSESKDSNVTYYHKKPVELTLNAKPEPPKNLTGIDLSIWKSENWK